MTNTTNTRESDSPKTYTAEEVAVLIRLAKSEAKKTKTHSEFFVTAEGQPMAWRNLSETKRFMENNYPEILTTGMTSKSFHNLLVSKMGL